MNGTCRWGKALRAAGNADRGIFACFCFSRALRDASSTDGETPPPESVRARANTAPATWWTRTQTSITPIRLRRDRCRVTPSTGYVPRSGIHFDDNRASAGAASDRGLRTYTRVSLGRLVILFCYLPGAVNIIGERVKSPGARRH